MSSVYIHCATSTDAFSTRSSKTESRINSVLDFNERVKEHWSSVVHIDVIRHILGSVAGVSWVCSINIDSLQIGFFCLSKTLVKLLGVVRLQKVRGVSN